MDFIFTGIYLRRGDGAAAAAKIAVAIEENEEQLGSIAERTRAWRFGNKDYRNSV